MAKVLVYELSRRTHTPQSIPESSEGIQRASEFKAGIIHLFISREYQMGLKGKYHSGMIPGYELNITANDDSNGSFTGNIVIKMGVKEYSLNVTGHYHFRNSVEDPTLLEFYGARANSNTEPGIYVGYSGVTFRDKDYRTINGHGGIAMVDPNGKFSSIPLGTFQKS
jgi:hypothetical protein